MKRFTVTLWAQDGGFVREYKGCRAVVTDDKALRFVDAEGFNHVTNLLYEVAEERGE